MTITQRNLATYLQESVDRNGANDTASIHINDKDGVHEIQYIPPTDPTSSTLLSAFCNLSFRAVLKAQEVAIAPRVISLGIQ